MPTLHTYTGCRLRPLQVPIRWLCDWQGPYQCLHFASNSLLPGSGSFPYFLYTRFKSNRLSLLLCLCSFCQGDQIIQPWSFMTISVTLVGFLCWAKLHSENKLWWLMWFFSVSLLCCLVWAMIIGDFCSFFVREMELWKFFFSSFGTEVALFLR